MPARMGTPSVSKRQLQRTVPGFVLRVASIEIRASLVLSMSLKDAKIQLRLRQIVYSEYELLWMQMASLL